MEELKDILEYIKGRRNLTGVQRFRTEQPIDINKALAMMEIIGKERTPKFRIDDQNRWVFTQLIKWLYADQSMQAADPEAAAEGRFKAIPGRLTSGIYISGNTGTGKSWALELLNIFADIDMPKVKLGEKTVNIHFESVRAEYIWERCTEDDKALNRYKTTPILCIQDLGSEPIGEAVRMGTRREPLRQIIEARGDRDDLITLITSNHTICSPEIEKRYTDRVVSRLRGMCNLLILAGKDRRTI